MLELTKHAETRETPTASVTLSFELRQRSRLRAKLDDGREAAIVLPRGRILRNGDRLSATSGEVVLVRAAHETLSEVSTTDAQQLARAAYHLGNRHVPVQVGECWLRFAHDHVLDDMLRGLGLPVCCVQAGFEPEAGAYAAAHAHLRDVGHGHHHHHDGHDHDHCDGDHEH